MQKLLFRLKKCYATAMLRFYRFRILLCRWCLRHESKIISILLIAGILISNLSLPILERVVGGYFKQDANLGALKTLLGGTGSALIGATAIAFSLVVFSMQTNVERMPHGLFRRLSSDKKLLGSFFISFLIAVIVASTSLIPNGHWAVYAIVIAIWGIFLILLLFLYAYRRALKLINPIEQLTIMFIAVRRDIYKWNSLFSKSVVLVNEEPSSKSNREKSGIEFNATKAGFFNVNASWDKNLKQAIHYAISYSKRFAEQGDYEVTDYAFDCVMRLNAAYCDIKNGTFVGSIPFFEISNNNVDGVINTSLEQLRQTMQGALAKGDERLAGSTLRGICGLYGVYLAIDYPEHDKSKHHAMLASSYLGSAVESVATHNMPDLMMEGIRLMGKSSTIALDHTTPTGIVGMAGKIATLSTMGVLNANYQPVTLIAFEQLAEITFQLILKGKYNVKYTFEQLRKDVTEAAKYFLETSDSPFSFRHSTTLGPYFSSTSPSSLRTKLTTLVNQLITAPTENERVSEIIFNIEAWADQIYAPQKDLLLISILKRSSFTFDVISWAVGVSELLNVLSNAPACSEHLTGELRKDAIWLISTLSWIPNDRETVTFVENYSLTESLFEAALSGLQRECFEFYECCKDLLFNWAIKGGGHDNGWGILERTTKALIALTIMEGTLEAVSNLKIRFSEMLSNDKCLSLELRTRTSIRLVRSADELGSHGVRHSRIDDMLSQLNHDPVRTLIYEIAQILAPDE